MINYQDLIDEAMLGIVRKVLMHAQDNGLQDEQCFYISFRTDYPEVILSKQVRSRYPKEITIVLQYQYEHLHVLQDRFSVNIAFGGIKETIEVPFAAMTGFADPSVNFSLQFHYAKDEEPEDHLIYEDSEILNMEPAIKALNKEKNGSLSSISDKKEKTKKKSSESKAKSGEIVSIDQFRKKRK